MRLAFIIFQIIIGIALMGAILMQNSKGGLGSAFGGGGEFRSKRGAEVLIFRATIILSALFLIVSVIVFLIH